MAGEWAIAVGVVGFLKRLGTFAWEAVHNGAAKGAPNTLASSLDRGEWEVKEREITYLAGLPHCSSPLVLSRSPDAI